jgi:hypothetical protein
MTLPVIPRGLTAFSVTNSEAGAMISTAGTANASAMAAAAAAAVGAIGASYPAAYLPAQGNTTLQGTTYTTPTLTNTWLNSCPAEISSVAGSGGGVPDLEVLLAGLRSAVPVEGSVQAGGGEGAGWAEGPSSFPVVRK